MNRSRGAALLALALGIAAVGGTAQAAVIYNSAPDFTRTNNSFDNVPLTLNSGPGRITINLYEAFPGFMDLIPANPSRMYLLGDPGSVTLASLGDAIGSATPN